MRRKQFVLLVVLVCVCALGCGHMGWAKKPVAWGKKPVTWCKNHRPWSAPVRWCKKIPKPKKSWIGLPWRTPPMRLVLAEDGASSFTIVVGDNASPSTRFGAGELQRFLRDMSGAEIPVCTDAQAVEGPCILLGDSAKLRGCWDALQADVDEAERKDIDTVLADVGNEGYLLWAADPHLVILGGALRGNMYGVYGLLEDHLDCRWFTPDVSRIPEMKRIVIEDLCDMQVPALEYREPFVKDCFDGDWCARNRVNSSASDLDEQRGGKVRFGAGMFVHTFNRLMPPEKYFAEHPEYYSEIDGVRVGEHTQLCCTNEDVIRICTEAMLAAIASDPDAYVYSLSQNDWHDYCECPKCTALAEAEGSQMAPVLQLVNRVAEEVEKQYPDKAIETLAYQYTRKPCKTLRPRPNVIIRLCSIECCFMHPLETCDSEENREFVADLEGWAQVANRLWVWDYVTSFRNYLCPFPNLRVRDDNIRLLIRNNVTGIFEQDVYNTFNGELSPLSGYLGAKLLWNPDYDEDDAIDEFLEGVYGKAAKPIRKYIDMLHDKVEKENLHVGIWVAAGTAPYLDEENLDKAQRLWDEAERAVRKDPDTLERVQIARLSADYAYLEHQRVAGLLSKYKVDHKNFRAETSMDHVERVQRFFEVARRANITRLAEHRPTLDEYQEMFAETMKGTTRTFTPQEPVEPGETFPRLKCACYEGKWQQLPDFDAMTPVKTGTVPSVELSLARSEENFGLRFTGYLMAPRDGVYTFTLASNDGSRLRIGDELVIDNDGLHGMEAKAGVVGLKEGAHPIVIEYFQEGGTTGLKLSYEGPGIKLQEVPPEALCHTRE